MSFSRHPKPNTRLATILIFLSFLILQVFAQDCSKLNPCASGCCSKFGYCGTGDDFCSSDNCVDTCDFKLGCDASNPCTSGCCSKFGFCGLGPDYCDPKVCVAGCESKSYCDPGYGAEWAEVANCPLNVCCSKFGFCGLTEEFCGDKKVKRPSCSKDSGLSRIVGYYESWSNRRTCNTFYPEQIPLGVYTHLNFAFATIDPETFEVKPASSSDTKLYTRLTDLKKQDPDLKVFIALGGWTFNDPGPTATTFSDLAASEANQKAFFKSLSSFMSTYNFDGVDIDWEYPGADDRSGRKEDFSNFPKFMSNLKNALKGTGGRDGLSITLPASYWYLQNFDIKELEKSVDWFNMMTYDLHGTWDKGNKWLGNYLNAHTNLTEITNALDLLWRNNIDPSHVVLGTAFYGRAFTATSTSCMTPGCTFESGGVKGECSHEVSILLNSEIKDIVDAKGISPVLYEDAAVKVATWDDQWVAYDDEDTIQMKADFAKTQCLGGVMVWAVSHDTQDAKYSQAIGVSTSRSFKAIQRKAVGSDGVDTVITTKHNQCKWTNCKEACPANYVTVARSDSDRKSKTEIMLDQSGCDGDGAHTFCCPVSTELPTCGWYDFHNGKCGGTCPSGMTSVGSNSMYCNNNKFQMACCTDNNDAVKLYDNCEWASSDGRCDDYSCPWSNSAKNQQLVVSSTGNGGAECNVRSANPNTGLIVQERKYCCDTSDSATTWDSCRWVKDFGPAPAGRNPDNFCYSGCPDDLVRVAMDKYGDGCGKKSGAKGARAYCCSPHYSTTETVENPEIALLRMELDAFLEEPVCDYDSGLGGLTRRLVLTSDGSESEDIAFPLDDALSMLQTRDVNGHQYYVSKLLFDILTATDVTAMIAAKTGLWDNAVKDKFPYLITSKLKMFLEKYGPWKTDGPQATCDKITCNINYMNDLSGGTTKVLCTDGVCSIDSDVCCSSDDAEDSCALTKRDIFSNSAKFVSGRDEAKLESSYRRDEFSYLAKRGTAEQYNYEIVTTTGGRRVLRYWMPAFPSSGDWEADDPIYDTALDFSSLGDCTDVGIIQRVLPNGDLYEAEHIFERNILGRFYEDAAAGLLRSGDTISIGNVHASFFIQALNAPILNNPPVRAGGFMSDIPAARIGEALGSNDNPANFVLLLKSLNGMKSRIWRQVAPIEKTKMEAARNDTARPELALLSIRSVLVAISYHNFGTVHDRLLNIASDMRSEFRLAQNAWNATPGNVQVNLVGYWDRWYRDFLTTISLKAQTWVQNEITMMRQIWGVRTDPTVNQVLEILDSLEATASRLVIDQTGLDPVDS